MCEQSFCYCWQFPSDQAETFLYLSGFKAGIMAITDENPSIMLTNAHSWLILKSMTVQKLYMNNDK